MRLQQITVPGHPELTRFAASQTEASATRRELATQSAVGVRSITIEPVEVDTKKEGLIAFLNDLVRQAKA